MNIIKQKIRAVAKKNKGIEKIIQKLNTCKAFIITSKYKLKYYFPLPTSQPKRKFVLSSTTTLSRLNKIYPMMESIYRQSILPEKFILWLSKDIHKNQIPKKLDKYTSRGLEIRFVEDVGPHTKMMYAIKEFNSKYVVVSADSDMIYSNDFLEKLLKNHRKYPKSILCFHASLIRKTNNKIASYLEWNINWNSKKNKDKNISTNVFPKSDGGMLYPKNIFSPELWNVKVFRKLTPKNDDIWVKAIALKENIPCVKLLDEPKISIEIYGMGSTALFNHNIKANDNQVKATFDHYDLTKKLE